MNIKDYLHKFPNIWDDLPETGKKPADLAFLTFLGFLIGLCAGAIIAIFRISTSAAYTFAVNWTGKNLDSIWVIGVWIVFCILGALLVGYFIRNSAIRFGGAQWIIDAIQDGQSRPWLKILIPKFIGSWLVMACGVSVGREGPCIEMGAATALGLKNFDKKDIIERRFFILGGCSAGLGAAFSAPFAGLGYVYEIMKEKMDSMLFLFLLSGGIGLYVSVTLVFGLDVMLPFGNTPLPDLKDFWLLVPLAIFCGLGGILYNYLLRFSMLAYASQKLVPLSLRPLFSFIGAAIMVLVYPALTGEGLTIFPSIQDGQALMGYLCFFAAAKLVFTAFCYGSGIPAGLMVPVICIGGVMGGIYGDFISSLNLLSSEYSPTCIVLGMAAAFAAAERAPITGLILITEMTGAFNTSAGMLLVTAIAAMCARLAKVKGA